MKSSLLLTATLCAATLAANAADKAESTEPKSEKKSRTVTVTATVGDRDALEKVTFLGVETGPVPEVLAEHLGIERDFGLAVRTVAKDSPAAGVLQKNDVLRKLDDQMLVDSRQLSVLIRAKKPGDAVKLTLIRAGKEQVVTAKLGERELPKNVFHSLNFGDGGQFRFFGDDSGPVIERLRELPGIAREEINDALRVIGNDRPHWVAGSPRVHVLSRKVNGGSTILNLAEGNFVFSDDAGSLEVNASKGERQLTLKDASGKVTFQGPINTDEQREALPPEVKERLKKLETVHIEFNADESLQQEGAAVKPVEKTQARRAIRIERGAPAVPHGAVRPL